MLKHIYLHGHLKEIYSAPLSLEVSSVAEALRGMCVQIPGFREAIREGQYKVCINTPKTLYATKTFSNCSFPFSYVFLPCPIPSLIR